MLDLLFCCAKANLISLCIMNIVHEIEIMFLDRIHSYWKNFKNTLVSFIDVDECSKKPNVCGKAVCKNTPGDYICECPEGYRYEPKSGICTGTVLLV